MGGELIMVRCAGKCAIRSNSRTESHAISWCNIEGRNGTTRKAKKSGGKLLCGLWRYVVTVRHYYLGPRGRRFESSRPDQLSQELRLPVMGSRISFVDKFVPSPQSYVSPQSLLTPHATCNTVRAAHFRIRFILARHSKCTIGPNTRLALF
jgi:hypothetical protein